MPASIHQLYPERQKKPEKAPKKRRWPRRVIALFALLVTIIVVGVVQLVVVSLNSRHQAAELEEAKETLRVAEQQRKRLNIEIKQLKDPEYLAKLVRDKYLMSKSGELIFTLPDEQK